MQKQLNSTAAMLAELDDQFSRWLPSSKLPNCAHCGALMRSTSGNCPKCGKPGKGIV